MAVQRAPCLVELSGVQLTPEMWHRTIFVGGTRPASAYISTAERWLRENNTIYLSGIGHCARYCPHLRMLTCSSRSNSGSHRRDLAHVEHGAHRSYAESCSARAD